MPFAFACSMGEQLRFQRGVRSLSSQPRTTPADSIAESDIDAANAEMAAIFGMALDSDDSGLGGSTRSSIGRVQRAASSLSASSSTVTPPTALSLQQIEAMNNALLQGQMQLQSSKDETDSSEGSYEPAPHAAAAAQESDHTPLATQAISQPRAALSGLAKQIQQQPREVHIHIHVHTHGGASLSHSLPSSSPAQPSATDAAREISTAAEAAPVHIHLHV